MRTSTGWPHGVYTPSKLRAGLGGALKTDAFLPLAGGDKSVQLLEAAGPAGIVVVAVFFAGETFMAEMHFGFAAHIAQENGDQGGVLAVLPFPGEGQPRGF